MGMNWNTGEFTVGYTPEDQKAVFGNNLVSDTSDDAISNLANDLNVKLSDDTKDYLYQYYLQRKNDEWAWDKTMQYDNTRYQRTVADLRKAGLNPFLALQSLSPSSQSANAGNITSGSITNQLNNKRDQGSKVAGSIMSILGIIAAAMIYAMA